jgi:hypothetical protein
MNSYFKKWNLLVLLSLFFFFGSCEKFLDEKTDATLSLPTTLKDLQALLDTYYIINETDPSADEVSATEFYVTDADFSARTETDQRLYTWQNDNVLPALVNDWYYAYSIIYRSNTVLENVEPANLTNESWRNLRGQALFHRAKAYLQAVNIWAKVYDPKSAASDLGVPIRLTINFNEKSERATVQQNYELIIADLKEAIALLPEKQIHVVRPSKAAAAGLLARAYLWMGNYAESLKYADVCLSIKSDLLDFNTLTATATYPIAQFNIEVTTASKMANLSIIGPSRAKIAPELYLTYAANDLRKAVCFKDNGNGTYSFKGSYEGSSIYFSGLATDELYLTRAECKARLGKVADAMIDLNTLLKKRYKTGMFIDYNLTDQHAAVELILNERRKELLFRGLRWADIKRLNREGANISLSRTVAGKTYTLAANSLRFAIPLPDDVVALSGMLQNSY